MLEKRVFCFSFIKKKKKKDIEPASIEVVAVIKSLDQKALLERLEEVQMVIFLVVAVVAVNAFEKMKQPDLKKMTSLHFVGDLDQIVDDPS